MKNNAGGHAQILIHVRWPTYYYSSQLASYKSIWNFTSLGKVQRVFYIEYNTSYI